MSTLMNDVVTLETNDVFSDFTKENFFEVLATQFKTYKSTDTKIDYIKEFCDRILNLDINTIIDGSVYSLITEEYKDWFDDIVDNISEMFDTYFGLKIYDAKAKDVYFLYNILVLNLNSNFVNYMIGLGKPSNKYFDHALYKLNNNRSLNIKDIPVNDSIEDFDPNDKKIEDIDITFNNLFERVLSSLDPDLFFDIISTEDPDNEFIETINEKNYLGELIYEDNFFAQRISKEVSDKENYEKIKKMYFKNVNI